MKVTTSNYLLPGQVVLKRAGGVVWVCRLSAPWEDVDCDEIVVAPSDAEEIRMRTLPKGATL